jgi:hypothetical protein
MTTKMHKTIILAAFSNACKSFRPLRLRVFVKQVLRRISELKRDEVTGDWRKQHKKEFHNLYSSANIWKGVMGKACSMHGPDKKSTQNFCQQI